MQICYIKQECLGNALSYHFKVPDSNIFKLELSGPMIFVLNLKIPKYNIIVFKL